mgnify:CR=1 FL=1
MAEEFKKRQEEIQKLVLEFELQVKNNIDFYYDSEYYERIVKWYIDNHKFKLGLKAIEIALSQHKFSSDLLIQKANILIALQKFSKALMFLDKAHTLNPKDENDKHFLLRQCTQSNRLNEYYFDDMDMT